MDFSEAITEVMEKVDHLPPVDSQTGTRRSLLGDFLKMEYGEAWRDNGQPWHFKDVDTTVTIPVGDAKVLLPADWSEFGVYGGVYRTTDGKRIDFVNPQEMRDLKRRPGISQSFPSCYSIYGQDAVTYRSYIQIPPNGEQVQLYLAYAIIPPTLDESANKNNLKRFPEEYHEGVLINALKARAYESRGDQTWKIYQALRDRSMKNMRATLRKGKEGDFQLKGFFDE